MTESSPLTESKKKKRRRRRCARAIVGFVALVALCGSVGYLVSETVSYFVPEKDRESMFEFLLVNNFLGRLIANNGNSSKEQQQEEEEKDDQLTYRMLPEGGRIVEMVSNTSPSVDLGNDHYDNDISQQERQRRERGRLILDHERLVLEQREAHAQREVDATHRKTLAQDEGNYNNAHQEDYPTVHQDHPLADDERWNDPHNEYPFMEEGRKLLLEQEDEGHVHEDQS